MPQSFGPENARLTVRTARTGAASKAGHDLLIEVTSWSATLDPEADPALTLSADSRSLRVLEGTGGIQTLDDDDKAGIDADHRRRGPRGRRRSSFARPASSPAIQCASRASSSCAANAGRSRSSWRAGADGRLTGTAVVRQSEWGMKPYSTLFGTLKVADEVEVAVDTRGG